MELRRLLQRFIDVCEAIDYAHSRGVLHRDLKPGNIMLGRYGETLVVDWGLAKPLGKSGTVFSANQQSAISNQQPPPPNPQSAISNPQSPDFPEPPLVPSSDQSSDPTVLGSALGTPAYMSPEQAQGRIDLLSRVSDVFSLGATLYHLLTGQPPYVGEVFAVQELACKGEYARPRSIAPGVVRPLEAICLKAMASAPKQRYVSAKELAVEVEHWLADEPVAAAPEGIARTIRRWSRKNPGTSAAALVFFATALSGLILNDYGYRGPNVVEIILASIVGVQLIVIILQAIAMRGARRESQSFELRESNRIGHFRA